MNDVLKPTAAKAFVRARDTGKFCFEKRSVGNSDAGKLALLGGKLHAGESAIQGLLRELVEETGSIPGHLRQLTTTTQTMQINGKNEHVMTAIFIGIVVREQVLKPRNEVTELVWAALDAITEENSTTELASFCTQYRELLNAK